MDDEEFEAKIDQKIAGFEVKFEVKIDAIIDKVTELEEMIKDLKIKLAEAGGVT